jgi:hypothetical protein
LVIFVLVVR